MSHEASTEDLEKSFPLERRFWAAERAGWLMMALFVLGALVGLTGPGALSHRELRSPDGKFVLAYERFIRLQTKAALSVHVPAQPGLAKAVLFVSRPYLQEMTIEEITPTPEKAGGDSAFPF